MTTYYVDGANGDDGWTGTHSEPQNGDGPWETIGKYIHAAARTPGDICWVRRDQNYVEGTAVAISSGTSAAHIILKGDDGTVPEWTGDANNRPVVDFNSAGVAWAFAGRAYWDIANFEVKDSDFAECCFKFYTSGGPYWVENCYFHNNENGAIWVEVVGCYVKDCTFAADEHRAIQVIRGYLRLENCTIDGETPEGIATSNGLIDIVDCTFGDTTEMTQCDILLSGSGSLIRARNILLASDGASEGLVQFGLNAPDSALYAEDWGQVKGAHKSFYFQGTVEKDTGVTHSGGASSSAKVLPSAQCCADHPLTLADSFCQGDFQIWCPASSSTITVYIRDCGTWGTPPDNTELYITAEYWDGATAKRVESTHSTQTLDGSNWVAFTTTFTPNAAGWVYVKVYLILYEDAGDGIYVDVKPLLS